MKKPKRFSSKIITSLIFVISPIILFVNNLTLFFTNYGLQVQINIITWVAIAFSILWWMFLFGKENKLW